MNLVEFLEARIAEHKTHGPGAAAPPSLARPLLAERAQEREILSACKEAALAAGIIDTEQPGRTTGLARYSMLTILAAGYKWHAGYRANRD